MNQIVINTFEIIQNFVIGIANDRNTASIQCGGSCSIIINCRCMTIAIYFNDQAKFCTIKINDEIGNRFLS